MATPGNRREGRKLTVEQGTKLRETRLNLVGNLTLTDGKPNSRLSNTSWAQRRPKLQNKSTFLIIYLAHLAAEVWQRAEVSIEPATPQSGESDAVVDEGDLVDENDDDDTQ